MLKFGRLADLISPARNISDNPPSWQSATCDSSAEAEAVPQRARVVKEDGDFNFVVFLSLWVFIGLVSAYDGYLTVRYHDLLHILEQNPLGRWIMDLDSGLVLNADEEYSVSSHKLANFLGLKFAGTIIGLAVMLGLHRYKASLGLLVTSIMAGLQGLLALYLVCF